MICKHGIDLNQPCSLCATPARLIASGDDGEGGSILRLERRKELRQTRPLAASDDAGRSEARDAGTSGIWLVTLNATDGPNPRTRA